MLDGNIRQALSYYNQALVLDEADLFSLFELGRYHWIIGERSRARRYFERLKRHDRTEECAGKADEIVSG